MIRAWNSGAIAFSIALIFRAFLKCTSTLILMSSCRAIARIASKLPRCAPSRIAPRFVRASSARFSLPVRSMSNASVRPAANNIRSNDASPNVRMCRTTIQNVTFGYSFARYCRDARFAARANNA